MEAMEYLSLQALAGTSMGTESQEALPGANVSKRNPAPQEQKLIKAASEFESILISSFWKSMMETFSSDDDSDDPGHTTFQDMGLQAMSEAMGKAGGLGLGRMLVQHLEGALEKSKPIQGTGRP